MKSLRLAAFTSSAPERPHDSRRIDNQLRGRQPAAEGDPGGSRFFLFLQDDLLRIFGGRKNAMNLMLRLRYGRRSSRSESNGDASQIEAYMSGRSAEPGNRAGACSNMTTVMNEQRQAVYAMRRGLLEGVDQKERVLEMTKGVVGGIIDQRCPTTAHPENYDIATPCQADLSDA